MEFITKIFVNIQPLPYIVAFTAPNQGIYGWTMEARFMNESEAKRFLQLPHGGERRIFVTRDHYDFYSKLLPDFKEQFIDHIVDIE